MLSVFALGNRFFSFILRPFINHPNESIALLTLGIAIVMAWQSWYQKFSTDRVWSAQQVATIYEEECEGVVCVLKASPRSREVALRWYVAIEGHDGDAKLPRAVLAGLTLSEMDLSRIELKDSRMQGVDLTKTVLKRADLSGASLDNATLTEAELVRANLSGASLLGTILTKTDLTGANLENAVLGDCVKAARDYGSGDLYSTATQLEATSFEDAKMVGAQLCGLDLSRVSGLAQWQIENTEGNAETLLPKKLQRPKGWSLNR